MRNNLTSKILSSCPSKIGQLVLSLDALKIQPDVEAHPELGNWKYQRLYQILLDLSVGVNSSTGLSPNGSMLYSHIIDLVKWPLANCPDLLALGLLGSYESIPNMAPRKELLGLTIPAFLSNHPNAATILHIIWNLGDSSSASSSEAGDNQWAKQVLLQSMCDYYIKSPNEEQQHRLSRILDVAQDLKGLSLLLNGSCYPFVIDLACLASRREYLKLDKWLSDKIQSNGEYFVAACVNFLTRRTSSLHKGSESLPSAQQAPGGVNFPSDTLATMLACLHNYVIAAGSSAGTGSSASNNSGSISKELQDNIMSLVANTTVLISTVSRQQQQQQHSSQQPPPPGVGTTSVSTISASSLVPGNAASGSAPAPATTRLISSHISSNNLISSISSNIELNNPADSRQLLPGLIGPTPPPGPVAIQALRGSGNPAAASMQQGPGANASSTMNALVSPHPNIQMSNATQPGQQIPQQALPGPQADRQRTMNDLATIFPEISANMSPEIEREADTYFQRIYNQSSTGMSIEDVLEMLRRFQDSQNQRERDIFACMIRNLFKEYCYFPQYPDKELNITAQLFGGIIQMGLVKYMALVVALRYVLEALRKPPRSKMYFFGISALDRFKGKLRDYPLYCQHLTSIPHFDEFPPYLVEYIRCGANSNVPTSAPPAPLPNPQVMPPQAPSNATPAPTRIAKTSLASADITILLNAGETTHQTPPEAVQDKVAFIINNLSQINLQQKTEEFKEVIGKDEMYYEWIAQYFVMKRASIELNFHSLYSNFLDVLSIPKITQFIISETHRNIKVLLLSNKEADNFSDRSLLKNLGHWLGMLTIAKSKPILSVELDLKKLLIEAYHKGTQELLYVVPFIAKILESTAKSKVFKPPNPWTMGLLHALVELHQEPQLKLNLKFEVEVLCKALSLDTNSLVNLSNVLSRPDLKERVFADPQLGPKVQPAPQVPIVGQRDNLDNVFQRTSNSSDLNAPPESLVKRQGVVDARSANPSPPQIPGPSIPSPGAQSFHYHEIQCTLSSLAQHITVPANITIFQMQPALKPLVRLSIEKAVTEWINPIVERSVKISIITAEKIVRKDFALDPDENALARAAHQLIRNLAAGMALITAKDTIFMSILRNLVEALTRQCPNYSKEVIEQAAHAAASENIDFACCFVQKSTVEKATVELDKRLAPEYELRRKSRASGKMYFDTTSYAYHVERLPEQIRTSVGAIPPHLYQIYDEIGRNIPGFVAPVNEAVMPGAGAPVPQVPVAPIQALNMMPQALQQPTGLPRSSAPFIDPNSAPVAANAMDTGLINLYDKLVNELSLLIDQYRSHSQPAHLIATMQNIENTVDQARQNIRDIVYALTLIQRLLEAISELLASIESGPVDLTLVSRARDLYLVILKALTDERAYGQQWTTKQITRLVLERLITQHTNTGPPLPDELFDVLMRSGLINLHLLDVNLAPLIETAQSHVALAFGLQFIKIYGPQGLSESDVSNIMSALMKLTTSVSSQISLEIQQILEVFRQPEQKFSASSASVGPVAGSAMPIRSQITDFANESSDVEFREKTEVLLRDWITCYYNTDVTKLFGAYVQQMNSMGILKTDDSITRFFRHATEACVDFSTRYLNSTAGATNIVETRTKCFQTLDAFSNLILMLVKSSGNNNAVQAETTAKINLLNKVLNIIATVAISDQDSRAENFQHLPYYRILIILFMELSLAPNNLGLAIPPGTTPPQLDLLFESIQYQILTAFCATLRILKPSKCPSFAYAWLDFVSHRVFIEKCLNGSPSKSWQLYAQLLIEMIRFLAPYLKCVERSPPIDLLYKGILKLFLVLLHDFPEFLCEFCYELCDSIPCNAVQLRNMVLSAFPRNMRLPDPFTPNLKIDQLPEIIQMPKGATTNLNPLASTTFKGDLDSYLRLRSPVTFLSDLRGHLQLPANQTNKQVDGTRYNVQLMNALVFYVGQSAIASINPRNINMTTIAHSSHMDIFQNLAVDLDTQGMSCESLHNDNSHSLSPLVSSIGRYLFINAMANQLRYPNAYTHYFSCALVYLFAESNTQAIQEQITRVLLERLIVNRPHPWGLLVTFIELIKHTDFWNYEFVHCAPEIEK